MMIDAAPAVHVEIPVAPADFSIARLYAENPFQLFRPCSADRPGDILVCGRRGDRGGMGPLGLPPGLRPPDPTLPVGLDLGNNVRAGLDVTEMLRPDGLVDRTAWIRIRFGF